MVPLNKQKGYLLITTLVLLVMLTVLGLAQVSINTTQTQIAANATDTETSFEKAEGALNEAANQLTTYAISSSNFISNVNGLYIFSASSAPVWQTVDWGTNAVISSFGGASGVQAKYLIEELPSVVQPGQNMKILTRIYRVTGRAVGQNGVSSVLIQGTIQLRN